MDERLMKILAFIVALQIMSTTINVLHKLEYLSGAHSHVAMAILSTMILLGYSGILNTIFLKRKFTAGRIAYIIGAFLGQLTILILSIMAWVGVVTYFSAIAIIHGIMGLIVTLNFVCAVHVVHEQKIQLEQASNKKKTQKYDKALEMLNKYYQLHKKEETQDLSQDSAIKTNIEVLNKAVESFQKNDQKEGLLS